MTTEQPKQPAAGAPDDPATASSGDLPLPKQRQPASVRPATPTVDTATPIPKRDKPDGGARHRAPTGGNTKARTTTGQNRPTHAAAGQDPPPHAAAGQDQPTHAAAGQDSPTHAATRQDPPTHGAVGQDLPTQAADPQNPQTRITAGQDPPTRAAVDQGLPTRATAGRDAILRTAVDGEPLIRTAVDLPPVPAAEPPAVPKRRGFFRRRQSAPNVPAAGPDSALPAAQTSAPAPEATLTSGTRAPIAASASGTHASEVPSASDALASDATAASRPQAPATASALETTTPTTAPAEGSTAVPADGAATSPAGGAAASPGGGSAAAPPGGADGDDGPQKTAVAVRLNEPLPSERPAGAPPDPWTAFASTPDRAPGWFRRSLRAVGRCLIHEYALAAYAAALIAVALTWPTLRYPLHTLPQDLNDPARESWQLAWTGHALLTHLSSLWQSNASYPGQFGFAWGDSLLGYAPATLLGDGPLAAVLRYNILFVLAHALLAFGGYLLVRQLGANRTGAAVAALAITYAPWRLAQEGHLDIISAGGIPLALALLARGHGWSLRHGFRPERRRAGWAALGWLVAAWQVSLGFSLGLPFLGVLGVILLVMLVRVPIRRLRRKSERPVLGWRLLIADTLGPLIVAGIAAVIAVPYFRVRDHSSATAEIKFFSPPLRSLVIGPAESRIWGGPHNSVRSTLGWPGEMSLLPGFVLYALALAGLVVSIWTVWQRVFLLLALVPAVILTLGSTFFAGRWTYLPLFGHLPASLDQRVPGRLMLWVTMLLAVLAAGAVAEFVRRVEYLAAQRMPPWPPWPGPWLRLATLVPLLLVIVEGWNTTAHPVVPAQPAAMRTTTGPVLVLPTGQLTDNTIMLWSTSRFQRIANGSGGFAAAQQTAMRQAVAAFPDTASVDYLRSRHIDTVLLIRSQVAGTPWERAGDTNVDFLHVQREDLPDAVLFRLN